MAKVPPSQRDGGQVGRKREVTGRERIAPDRFLNMRRAGK